MPNDNFECTNPRMCVSVWCLYRDADGEFHPCQYLKISSVVADELRG